MAHSTLNTTPLPPLVCCWCCCHIAAWVFVVICALNGKLLIRFLACRVTLSSSPRSRRCRCRPLLQPVQTCSLLLTPPTPSLCQCLLLSLSLAVGSEERFSLSFVSKLVNVIAAGPSLLLPLLLSPSLYLSLSYLLASNCFKAPFRFTDSANPTNFKCKPFYSNNKCNEGAIFALNFLLFHFLQLARWV